MRLYEFAVAQHVAQAEWEEFAHQDGLIRSIGEVRFDALSPDRSRLAIAAGNDASAADAVVQRFRDRLTRKRLLGEQRPTLDERIDEGVQETFPASDPVAVHPRGQTEWERRRRKPG